jgi:hypothetical protein
VVSKPRMAYAAETSAQLNEAAVASCVVHLFPSEDDPLEIEVTGTCPACGEDIVHNEPLVVVRGVDSGLTPETSRAVLAALRAAGMHPHHDKAGDQESGLPARPMRPRPTRHGMSVAHAASGRPRSSAPRRGDGGQRRRQRIGLG